MGGKRERKFEFRCNYMIRQLADRAFPSQMFSFSFFLQDCSIGVYCFFFASLLTY